MSRDAGLLRGAKALSVLNQKGGIDCMSCAWPEPDGERRIAEFCENGAKAVVWEADRQQIAASFFDRYSVPELREQPEYWLGRQGRLTEPVVLREGATHYTPISWDDAFTLIGLHMQTLSHPDEAAFYTSGRTSNEAAFLWQLLARRWGTNNLPDCADMCHESSGVALSETIGIGKGTVTLEDFDQAEVIVVLGQNPGTNHPRMLTTLKRAKEKGSKIIAINPLVEPGLVRFKDPQELSGIIGDGTELADLYLQVRINGDVALLKGIMKEMLGAGAVDREFVAAKTAGWEAFEASLGQLGFEELERQSGIGRAAMQEAARLIGGSSRIVACWAMGLTQHPNAVATIQEVVNLLLMRGSIGKSGAGVCPVRGHSNVQGDRTMGITERPGARFLDKLGEVFRFEPPQKAGLDTVGTIKAMHSGAVKIFFSLGGNFFSAAPDTGFTAEALRKTRLKVHIATKLNATHLAGGGQSLILPCLGRTEIDRQASGEQFVTTENSMGVVQTSQGVLAPAAETLRSEVAIVCGIARAVVGAEWDSLAGDYARIRDLIGRCIPGFEDYNARVRHPGGFYLPNPPRSGSFAGVPGGKALFTVHPLPDHSLRDGELIMMTIRSHDQFNTTVYGLDDVYRGISSGRRVIFMNAADIAGRGLAAGDTVDLVSDWRGEQRSVRGFTVVSYRIPQGNCATYFPETNPLVPVDHVAAGSNTPASKFVAITVRRSL